MHAISAPSIQKEVHRMLIVSLCMHARVRIVQDVLSGARRRRDDVESVPSGTITEIYEAGLIRRTLNN
jgi:hypothetical protein